jgi:hypothetical protein
MAITRIFFILFFFVLVPVPHAVAAEQALELRPLSQAVWDDNWAGGCWFQKEFKSKGGGGELMFLIRGEGKESVAVFDLNGELKELPYVRTIAKSKKFRLGARDTYLYQDKELRVQVTTIVTEVPQGNECAGDCSESSGFGAELNVQAGKNERRYKFNTGACGL